ncbi:MAG TPA: glycosyltransferase [Acetobacteraceae bacterium]|nr:glycosyltransferase [Acetobacteraceae bacterium]
MPIDRPARDVLKLPGETPIAWAVFDAVWYLQAYPNVLEALQDEQPATVLAWYLGDGQQRGHCPNMFFDESWHRRTYPAIDAMVRNGHFASAFDAYCRGGQARSPHWLFDETWYRRQYAVDLTDETLAAHHLVNGYDHFLRHGAGEGRIGHALFDADFFLSGLDAEEAALARQQGPFRHYIERIAAPVPEPRTSPLFDPTWYLQQYPQVAEAMAAGTWRSALHHYLCNDTPGKFDPLPQFSEHFYLTQNPGVAETVERRERRNGYAHFLLHGALELRAPCTSINLRWYAAQPRVRDDLDHGRAANAFAHWLLIGRHQGLLPAPPPEERPTEGQASTVFRRKADVLAQLLGRAPLDFTVADTPVVSVIMVLHDGLPLTLATLASLRANLAGSVELILVDSGSTDETRNIARYVRGAQVMRFDADIGPLAGANAGLMAPRADTTLLLSNDVEFLPDALPAALRCLASAATIGAVGARIVRPEGLLDEAGGIIWRNGSVQPYQPSASPLVPEATFRRDVDYCSGTFLLVRTSLLQQLEGFDDTFSPGSFEDVDLCVRIQQAGFRVVYDPAVALYRMARNATWPNQPDLAAAQHVFSDKHQDWLQNRPSTPDANAAAFARHAGPRSRRILFIEDTLPLRSLGSGFVRANDLVHTMAAMGYGVTVFPVTPGHFEPPAVYADMPDTVEIMHDRGLGRLREFLQERVGYYDAIWVSRTHNLDLVLPIFDRALQANDPHPQIVLDTEAIAALRQAEHAALAAKAFDLETALRQEFANAHRCQTIVAVNQAEAQVLRDLGCANVAVIGHVRELRPTPRPFDRRAGMLFIGAMHQPDSPNFDSLCWFVDAVLPLIEHELRWETRLTVVGYTAPEVSLDRFRDHPRVTLRGMVPDTAPLYGSHRLLIAPTRIAAGTPYKVHEAASFGLPVVATELLSRQLDWQDGHELLTAPVTDPEAFARQAVRLYRDPSLWGTLRENALERLRRENDAAGYAAAVESVLGPASSAASTWRPLVVA